MSLDRLNVLGQKNALDILTADFLSAAAKAVFKLGAATNH